MGRQLLVATGNRHKLGELSAMLQGWLEVVDLELVCAADFPEVAEPAENAETFEENALIKARAYCAATGLVTLADDSGLVIDALVGRPGVRSARYAETPAARIERVLREMQHVPEAQRTARFVCAMALCAPGVELTRCGTVEGVIVRAERGEGGFGYDPIFEVRDDGSGVTQHAGRTLAELDEQVKNQISHRGRAMVAIREELHKAFKVS